jgi:hypothetical protein
MTQMTLIFAGFIFMYVIPNDRQTGGILKETKIKDFSTP